jgi:hypothetical protein
MKIINVILLLAVLSVSAKAQFGTDNLTNADLKKSLFKSETPFDKIVSETQTKSKGDFDLNANLYMWMVSTSGEQALPINNPAIPYKQTPVMDISMKFSDAISKIKFAIMFAGSFFYKDVGLFYNVHYVEMQNDGTLPPNPYFTKGTFASNQFAGDFSLAYRYRLKNNQNILVAGFAGTRINSFDNTLDLTQTNNSIYSVSSTKTIVDPLIGAGTRIDLSKHWLLYFIGDVGGFGISSKFTGSILGTCGYKFTENWNVTLGLIYLYLNYDKDYYLMKMSQYGIVFSFGYML